jgi:hypothetical protein
METITEQEFKASIHLYLYILGILSKARQVGEWTDCCNSHNTTSIIMTLFIIQVNSFLDLNTYIGIVQKT